MVSVKELRIPFSWQERRVAIVDGAWFVPPCTKDTHFSFPGWEDTALFGNAHPIHIEYCSGNGAWIIERAHLFPLINWLAVEKRFDRARKIWAKAKNRNLTNLVVAWAEAHTLTHEFLPNASVEQVYINFPDPWPRRRQQKHRLISHGFIQEQARILRTGSRLWIVTDHEGYSQHIVRVLRASPAFIPELPEPYFIEAPLEYGTSFFDALFRGKNAHPRLHLFARRPIDAR